MRFFQNIQRGQGYTARLPGEGKSVLNKRERNVLDIHYGLMKAPPLMQISGWAFGFGSVCLSVYRSEGLSVCLPVCLVLLPFSFCRMLCL